MNKAQAIHSFWNSFGLPAYEENTVPQTAKMPYITYNVATAEIDSFVALNGSLWDYGTSWKTLQLLAQSIANYVSTMNPIKIETGFLKLNLGSPFSQNMNDEDDMIRRIYINLQAEFLTFN